jgi:hypothetical protein
MQTPIFLTKLSDESIIFIIDIGKLTFVDLSASLENGWTHLAISFFTVCNSPNMVFRETKIGKVARKIGKIGKN